MFFCVDLVDWYENSDVMAGRSQQKFTTIIIQRRTADFLIKVTLLNFHTQTHLYMSSNKYFEFKF